MDDIAEPLLWQLLPLQFIGKVLKAVLVSCDEILDLLDAETVILRNSKIHHIIRQDHLLGTADQILKKAKEELEFILKDLLYGEGLVMRQICLGI